MISNNAQICLSAVLLLLVSAVLSACTEPPPPTAGLVLINGGIYTVDADRNWAEAAAVIDGIIVAVGSNDAIQSYVGDGTVVVDLDGRMAMPGIHDSHVHPLEGAYERVYCNIYDADTIDAVVAMLRACADEHDGEWLNALGLDWSLFDVNGPDKSLLDGIADDKYIFVDGSDGHSALVNDKVLQLVGFDETSEDPLNGVIERRPGSREPSGTVRELARDLIDRLRPPRDLETSVAAMRDALQLMNSYGITSVYDVWVGEHEMRTYHTLAQSGDLAVRVLGAIIDEGVFEKHRGAELERVLRERSKYESENVSFDSIKIMVDGVVEGETAALLEPYVNADHHGTLNHTTEDLNARVARYYDMGLQLHFHTMGDAAVRAALDAIELARDAGDPARLGMRHTLSHLGLIDPSDMPRFAALNTGASVTMEWAYTDEWTHNLEIPVLGIERVRRLYPIHSVIEAGSVVLGGSDWNYGDLNPLVSIETAVTRDNPYGAGTASDFEVFDDEAVSLADMIDAYTINGAWQIHAESVSGSIEPGKRADIVVYDHNLFAIDPYEISEANVDLTIFDGEVVYRRGEEL